MTSERSSGGPLSGIRLIAIEQFGAGPFASLFFADLGADVIKIEDPGSGGDVGRSVPPGVSGDTSLYFETFNRGKRSIALDLKNPAGRSVLQRLAASADIVFNNLRGDLPDSLGLTYSTLAAVNERIVCASLSAYGRSGSRAGEPGYDALVQAEAGWAAMTGDPSAPPTKSGLSLVDYATGLAAAFGMLAAVVDATRTGGGRDVDVSLYDTALTMVSYPATWFLSRGVASPRVPMSAHPSIVPFQFFETSDGFIAVACAKEKFFVRLVELIDLPELAGTEEFSTFSSRNAHREPLLSILAERFRGRSTADWVERLAGAVPCAPVRSMEQALDVAELNDREMLAEYDHAELGQVRTVGSPIRMAGWRPDYRPGPGMGQHRSDVLIELGYSETDVIELARAGAFGQEASDG